MNLHFPYIFIKFETKLNKCFFDLNCVRIPALNFRRNVLRIGCFENFSLFELGILKLFFQKYIFLLYSQENKSKFLRWQGWLDLMIDDYPGFQDTLRKNFCPKCKTRQLFQVLKLKKIKYEIETWFS